MNYIDGQKALLGDEVLIAGKHKGNVVACIDQGQYSSQYPASDWSYLGEGALVDTDFGGIVHYTNAENEHIVLVRRGVNL
ncbi:hypothetical protein ACFW0H_11625 [Pseudomonas sp. CR3202]|uniref:hypothetical protein n=1 Tax=Pseudomonas sp. CR3202 TaxID=3351532 RepID=UPI003BF27721